MLTDVLMSTHATSKTTGRTSVLCFTYHKDIASCEMFWDLVCIHQSCNSWEILLK